MKQAESILHSPQLVVQPINKTSQKYSEQSIITMFKQGFAKLMLSNIGRTKVRYSVDGIPSTFNIRVGDALWSCYNGNIGTHRIMGVSWTMQVDSPPSMTLDVGRESPDLKKTLQLALELSN